MLHACDDRLNVARIDAGLSVDELWLRYFGLGGMSTRFERAAQEDRALILHDHDLIAHALNERFVELGGDRPVPYVN